MALFKDILHSDESLFKNELALDYSFLPKILPHREAQQRYIATTIKPLLTGKNGKNLFIYGAPGIGKTAAMRFVLNEVEEETEESGYPLWVTENGISAEADRRFKLKVNYFEYKLTMFIIRKGYGHG